MSHAAPKYALPLTYEELGLLAQSLDHEELGVAIRLIGYQAHIGSGIPDAIAASHLGINKRRWDRLRAGLLKALRLEDGRWEYAALAERRSQIHLPTDQNMPHQPYQSGEAAPQAHAARQCADPAPDSDPQLENAEAPKIFAPRRGPAALPLVFPVRSPGPRIDLGPAPAQRTATQPASLAKHIFDLGISLLTETGKSERSARDCIARMLKNYDVGFVAAAINDAFTKRDQIIEPHSWMLKRLKRYPTKEEDRTTFRNGDRKTASGTAMSGGSAGASRHSHPLATPEFLGLSPGMVDRIRTQNAREQTFTYVDPTGSEENSTQAIPGRSGK